MELTHKQQRSHSTHLHHIHADTHTHNIQPTFFAQALAEGATKEAQALEGASGALKQLALQLLSADKISPVP